jgi:multicomponent Na+:H+ antiporter subunit G
MKLLEGICAAFLLVGAAFFIAANVGLLRFPDVYTRLHALAKVDNLGLGFLLLGLLLQAESISAALKLVLVWLLAQAASAATCFLIARRAWRNGRTPWGLPSDREREES